MSRRHSQSSRGEHVDIDITTNKCEIHLKFSHLFSPATPCHSGPSLVCFLTDKWAALSFTTCPSADTLLWLSTEALPPCTTSQMQMSSGLWLRQGDNKIIRWGFGVGPHTKECRWAYLPSAGIPWKWGARGQRRPVPCLGDIREWGSWAGLTAPISITLDGLRTKHHQPFPNLTVAFD